MYIAIALAIAIGNAIAIAVANAYYEPLMHVMHQLRYQCLLCTIKSYCQCRCH